MLFSVLNQQIYCNLTFLPVPKLLKTLLMEVWETWSQNARPGFAAESASARHLSSVFIELSPGYLNGTPFSQVDEMLQCAKKCRKRSSDPSVAIVEFCGLAAQLKNCYEKGIPSRAQLSRSIERHGQEKQRKARKMSRVPKNEVFLGGSCNPTTWRQDIAIPLLNKLGISYYNPQVSQWRQELIELEHQAKEAAVVLFYVLDSQTRNVVGIIEAAHFAGSRRQLVLVMAYSQPGHLINDEPISQIESDDLCLAQVLLQDLVKKQGISVFESIPLAVSCTAEILRDGVNKSDKNYSDSSQRVKKNMLYVPDKQLKLQEVFSAFDATNCGEISLSDVCIAFQLLTKHKLSQSDLNNILSQITGFEKGSIGEVKVNYSQFCSIVSELKASLSNGDSEKWIVRWPTQVVSKENQQCKSLCLVGDINDSDLMVTSMLKQNKVKLSVMKCPQNAEGLSIIDKCFIVVFHVPCTTRSINTMTLASYCIGSGYNVVLSIQMLKKNTVIKGEEISQSAVADYNRGRLYLTDIAKQESIPVYDNLDDALLCAVGKCNAKSR